MDFGGLLVAFSRRRFFGGIAAVAAAVVTGAACAPKPTMDAARHALRGLWDAIVPGTVNGVVGDAAPDGHPLPGAIEGGVQEWFESVMGDLPAPFDFVADWFFRAWAADLDLWADTFHPPFNDGPAFGDLALGPTFAERGRQFKVMLMMKLFPGTLELKYLAALLLAKLAFYGDFLAESTDAPRVGGPLIGFPGPVSTAQPTFTFNRAFGFADPRMTRSADGLVIAP